MNSVSSMPAAPLLSIPADELTELELQIARRADELAGDDDRTPYPWLQAEREVLTRWMALRQTY